LNQPGASTLSEVKICTIGTWHLGSVTSACLASLGYRVLGVDNDESRVADLNRAVPPLFEPGLSELVADNLSAGRLQYTTDMEAAVQDASYVMLTFDTPIDERDQVDLREIFAACERFAPYLAGGAVLVVSSQVPVGTCQELAALVRKRNPQVSSGVACLPENLRLGQAIERFLHPDMLVIGADSADTAEKVERLLGPIAAPKVNTSLRTAEMIKHAINAYLATAISFINEIANLCERVEADAIQVSQALRLDQRIGPRAPLRPGLGFAGGTLGRDLRALLKLADQHNYDGLLLNSVMAVNERQNAVVLQKLREAHGSFEGLQVGVLGITYKAGTSATRRSAAVEIAASLIAQGARVKAFDPKAVAEELPSGLTLELARDPAEAAAGCDALLILTDWPEFQDLDYGALLPSMRQPVLLDPNNLLNQDRMTEIGFRYWGMGRVGTHQCS